MLRYICRRLIIMIPILLIVSVIIFSMSRFSGIDPVAAIVGGKQTDAQTVAAIREKYNLDKPWVIQYFLWISNILKGNFGESYRYQSPVLSLILERLPVTLGLVVMSSLLSVLIAVPVGIICAVKKNKFIDRFLSVTSLVFLSIPAFLMGILMIYAFTNFAPDFSYTGSFSTFPEYLQRLTPPAVALAVSMVALIARITRSSMIDQLDSGYVATAKAKGLPQRSILSKHVLKNGIIPVITIVGLQIGSLIVGTVLVESVFSLSGIGSLLVDSITTSDYPVVQAIILFLVVTFMSLNLIVDILYAVIDPRMRAHQTTRL